MVKKHKLKASWSKKESDVMIDFPLGVMTKSDGHFLAGIFTDKLLQEFKERGYDIETMKFEISVAPHLRPDKFATILSQEK